MGLSPDTWIRVNRGMNPADRRAITPCFDLVDAQVARRWWFRHTIYFVVIVVGVLVKVGWGL